MKGAGIQRSFWQVLRHTDTARCLQGVLIVAQEGMRERRRAGMGRPPLYQAHVDGVLDVSSFLANKVLSSVPVTPNSSEASSHKRVAERKPQNAFADLNEQVFEDITEEAVDPDAGLATEIEYQTFPSKQREVAVPASKLGRVVGFGRLGVGLAFGSAKELLTLGLGINKSNTPSIDPSNVDNQNKVKDEESEDTGKLRSLMREAVLSQSNSDLIASTLCRMRGAALKLGQMLSIQDETVLPPQLSAALERVRQDADIMPQHQLESVLTEELGKDWRNIFESFNTRPFAAASLGQVHQAILRGCGTPVAVKVQYPGVAESIDSDLANLKRLASLTGMFPKTLFIDRVIDVMKQELKEECDYNAEARHQTRFRELLADDTKSFFVPKVFENASSRRVLTTQLARGQPIDKIAGSLSQETRNEIGRKLLKLTLRELFEFRYMQTDPNFSNFLYDSKLDRVVLLDFGATREYGYKFVDDYMELVWAASKSDRSAVLDLSYKMGFLNGLESQEMINAHIEAGLEVGRPFQRKKPFDFRASKIVSRIGKHGDVFSKSRLTPPPQEVYSLHRKLAGAYMTCIRIGAVFECQDLLEETYARYQREKKLRHHSSE